MAREYIPVFLDWTEVTGELNDQEKGRLIDAIVLYAQGNDWQERIKGNERYLFPAFRRQIDRSNEISEARALAGSKPKQNGANRNKSQQIKANGTKANDKEEDKEEDKDYIPPISPAKREAQERFDKFWAAYPRHVGKPKAEQAFMALKPSEELLQTMLTAITQQRSSRQWQEDGGRYIPHPATWLHQKRWEDEPEVSKPAIVYGGNSEYGGDLF